MNEVLLALVIGFPPLAGLLCYVFNSGLARRILVAAASLVLIGSSSLLYVGGGFHYEPDALFEKVILVLDLALLVYFLYSGFKHCNVLTIGLSALQLLPIVYLEFGLGGVTVEPLIFI